MDYTNKALGLRVQTQIPLNVKEYALNEADLANLGPGNNLAYIYEKGLIIYCIEEGTRYEWKEMEIGDVGLISTNFIYPNNHTVFGINYSNKIYNFVKLKDIPNIDGSETKIISGTNISVTGNGTIATPYVISCTLVVNGSETKINAGTNISITGNGTSSTPYIINSTNPDGTETKLINSTTTTISGNGSIVNPYKIEVNSIPTISNQKILTYPASFTGTNYTLTSADANKLIFVNNGSANVTIIVPSGLSNEFFASFIRQGTGEVLFSASSTTINSSVGLRIDLRYDQVALDQQGSSNIFYLTGNTKI